MENSLIALGAMIIFTIAIYVSTWLQGHTITRTFTKWYFIVMLFATIVVTIITFIMSSVG
ncbi:hypothetical protein GCM10010918_30200 [Paenibacillus radicis (ex Gao et al. 2016)]|uniref:Uncharacterized protein n=1 Tax=Paenibacillus radicis (ex Gao et al. 2016) TaxID=1737354 RepID=A0A917HA08_9BACL|nr:hypothetical protein GCM10010918_30200 [Paenibacillus radicis (ex Gao et al. 2016)]